MSYRRNNNDKILLKFHWIPNDNYGKTVILPKQAQRPKARNNVQREIGGAVCVHIIKSNLWK